MSFSHLLDLATASGGILFVMPILLFVALVISIERTWSLTRMLASGRGVIARVAKLNHLDQNELEKECERIGNHPIGRILQVPLQFPDERDHTRLGDLIEEAILREVPTLDRSLWLLDTSVTLAPLLGLLGTIIGMFNAFQVLGNPGTAPTEITGGIAEALIATASGLFIAIIGMVFFNGLQARIRLLVHHMETVKMVLINRLDGTPATGAQATAHPTNTSQAAPHRTEAVGNARLGLSVGA